MTNFFYHVLVFLSTLLPTLALLDNVVLIRVQKTKRELLKFSGNLPEPFCNPSIN